MSSQDLLTNMDEKDLRDMLKVTGRLEVKMITANLEDLDRRMSQAENAIEELKRLIHAGVRQPLADVLKNWWNEEVGTTANELSRTEFVSRVLGWLSKDGKRLQDWIKYEGDIRKKLPERASLAPNHSVFLHLATQLVDLDKSGVVTQRELIDMQELTRNIAGELNLFPHVESMMDVLDVLHAFLVKKSETFFSQLLGEPVQRLLQLQKSLFIKQEEVSRSYEAQQQLVTEYVPKTREWLYEAFEDWVNVVNGKVQDKDSRIFLLLAVPGMGKSIFSAVLQLYKLDSILAAKANKDTKEKVHVRDI
jgi:hypothetical protein